MVLRLRPMIGHHVAHRQSAGNRVHRRQPAMDLTLEEMLADVAERGRQRFQRGVDQFGVAEIGKRQRIGARDQPVQHAVFADVVARAFVVDAAAAERFRHEPGARDLLAPERTVEQDRDPQVMRRAVEIGDVLDHRLAQLLVAPAHGGQPVVRQAHQHQVEVDVDRPLAVHHVELVAAGVGLADLEDAVVELDLGVDLRAQAFDQLLIAVLDRIQPDIAVDIHHEVLQRVEAVGVVALGRDIGTRHRLEEALRGRVLDLLVEQLLAIGPGPGMIVVVGADAFVILHRRDHFGAALAKSFDRVGGLVAVFLAHPRHVVEQFAVELHLLGVHRDGLQSEMLHQFAQRVGAGHRVIVEFGDAGLVHRRRGIEGPGNDLAAEPVRGLVDGDAAQVAEFPLQIPGAHQTARATADNRKIEHVSLSNAAKPRCPVGSHGVSIHQSRGFWPIPAGALTCGNLSPEFRRIDARPEFPSQAAT